MVNPWFKFYGGEYLSDTKMIALDATERGCWITILSLANQSEGGVIKYITEEKILELANVPPKERIRYEGLLQKLVNLKMLNLDNGDVTVKNWQKRQYSEGYLRVKRHRDNATVTPKITTEEKRIEENRKEKKRVNTPADLKKNFLNNPLMVKIQEQYPDRNYDFQFDLMVDWWQTNKNKLPQQISAFTNWLSKTKPDELLQADRRRKIEKEDLENRKKMLEETPRASQEKIDAMRAKMKFISKPI